jgi:predicted Zn-dependent protease with MMP-like domain
VNDHQRDTFDQIVEEEINALPPRIRALLDQVAVIVEDAPNEVTLQSLGLLPSEADELCGLHTGVAFTEQELEASGELPSEIMLFREGIIAEAGGWGADSNDAPDEVRTQIRITLLHEIGHQFGLDEDDLDRLGYA